MYVEYKTSWEKRALAVLLAVVFVFVGMPWVASADDGMPTVSGTIYSSTKYSKYIGREGGVAHDADNSNYEYTGGLETVTVNMYDYLTDAEITNNQRNTLNDPNYTYWGRYDPYTIFNGMISSSGSNRIMSQASENITIEYYSSRFTNSDDVKVYLFINETTNNSWPGAPMTYEGTDNGKYKFTYTFSPDMVGFTPNKLIFSNNGSDLYKTPTISQTMQKSYKYTFRDETASGNRVLVYQSGNDKGGSVKIHTWNNSGGTTDWNNQPSMNKVGTKDSNFYYQLDMTANSLTFEPTRFMINSGGTNTYTQSITDGMTHVFDGGGNVIKQFATNASCTPGSANSASVIYYPNLYSGLFLASGESGGQPEKYTSANKPSYNNFFWQPNMAQRNSGASSVQGLVDDELSGGTVTQGNTALPYFSKAWADTAANKYNGTTPVMKTWESNADDKISFPFYEVLIDANKVEGSGSSSQKAKFYQFNSKDSTVVFKNNDSTPGKSYFVESNDRIRGTSGKAGFFPYNDNNDSYTTDKTSGKNNNYGFGAKFEMTFKLNSDGMVETVDANGKPYKTGATKVNTRFEFTGDDDLWVFIDDKLVLDMGGAHSASSGFIDFAQKKAQATTAVSYGQGGNDNLALTGSTQTISGSDFTSLIDEDYDCENCYTSKRHKMTIFYMERGMSESNLMIRYNFPAEANYHKMKVKEQTDFSVVNAGLRDLTQYAAEDDVFKYTIKNSETADTDVLTYNSEYPTKKDYYRNVQDLKTKILSSQTQGTVKSYYYKPNSLTPDADGYKVVNDVSYNWVDDYANMPSGDNSAGKTDSSGQLYLLHGTTSYDVAQGGNTITIPEYKSSAEFEGQFKRYSLIKISQSNDLTSPSAHLTTDDSSAAAASLDSSNARTVDGYYTTERTLFSTLPGSYTLADNQAFSFRNDINLKNLVDQTVPQNESSDAIQMTELFKNTPKTGALSITKEMSSGTSDQEFTIKVRFEDIFGNTDADADTASDYTGILYNRYNSTDASRNVTNGTLSAGTVTSAGGAACGTFGIKAGEIVTIEKIPYNTKYTVYEEQDGFTAEYDNETGTIAVGSINSTSHKSQSSGVNNANNVTVTNTPEDENTLKIKEITSFTGVNSGLLSYTKKAAENDVFKYTISNQNTTTQGNSGYKYPTYDMYVRTSEADSNLKTTLTYSAPVPDTTHIYLDTSKKLNDNNDTWSEPGAVVGAYIYNSGGNGHTVLGEYITENLYRFDIYKVDSWSNTILKTSTPVNLYPYSSNNYTPPNPNNGTVVANTTYLWTDDFASLGTNPNYDDFNYMTNKTDGSGNFYLMYGTPTSESSAFFLKQFTRGSIMTVEQSGTLTSPNGGNPDTLQGTAQRGTTDNNNSLDKYYSTKKELSGAGSADGELTGTNDFTYNNGGSGAINITETFTNTVNKGNLVISKEINPAESANDAKTNAVFKFRIKLTNVFGVTNNNVSNTGSNKYSGIEVTRTGYPSYSMTDVTDSGVDYGEFELQQGESLTINGIPYNTHYEIQEIGQTGNDPYYEFNSVKSTTDGGTNWTTEAANTVSGNIVAGQTKEFMYANKRKTGRLTLTKTLTGESNANTTVGNNTDFYFTVTLTEPIGVTFENNYADITGFNSATRSDSPNSDGCYTYTFSNISVKQQDGAKTIIQNIPYGTYYTVTENSDSNNPHVTYDGNTANAFASGIINTSSAVANATVNNMYRKVEMTKTDAKNSSKTIDGAHYKLLKLNSIFANVYENGSQQQKDDLAALFAGATSTSTLSTYLTNDESSELTTGNNGNVSVDDVTMANSLTDGYYFFFETAAATDYDIDNSLTSGKLIKIDTGDASSTYTVTAGNYTDPRKTGDLDLIKAFSTASVDTTPAAEFTYNVTLSVSESGVRLSDYLTQSYLESLTGIVTNTIIINDSTVTFQINIKEGAGNKVTITGLPVGTSFIVTEKTKTGWKQISDDASGTISVGTSTATITNARVGSLTLVKDLATGTDENTYKTEPFTYTVTLENSDSNIKLKDFIKNAQISGVESLDSTHYNNSHIEVDVTVTKQTSVTISNIPYGTTYSVSEGSKSGWAKETPVAADYSGTITSTSTVSDAKTATFINAKTGGLVLSKSLLGGAPANPGSYTINVDLSNSPIALDGITLTAKDSSNANVTITHGSYSNSNKNHTISVPVSSGNNVTISGIPYGTSYTVTEAASSSTDTTNVEVTDNTSATKGTVDEDTSSVAVTNQYPCKLTLQKAITGTNAPASQHFTYHVMLSGMTGTYTIMNGSTEVGTNSTLNGSASFDVDMVAGTGVTISGIPYGTSYTVTEGVVANWTQTESSNTSGTINTAEITASFTNNYSNTPTAKTITLTKKDTSNTPLANVTFMLLKLKSSVSVDNSTVTDAFKNSTDYSSLSTYYDAAYGSKTTNSSGQVTFTEGQDGINAAFASGDKYFFYEVSATDPNIILDNSLTQAKIIAIADGTSNYNVTYTNTKLSATVILTKIAKERVGTTSIGAPLKDAKFKVFKSDGTAVSEFADTYTTGEYGQLTVVGLPPGSYYFEEQTAPNGYSEIDSSTGQKRRVPFEINSTTTVINLSCSDEMAPAYIKLYEHINEKLSTNWGDPTFIFKITQTKDASNNTPGDPKEYTVALTVDDDGKSTVGLTSKTVGSETTYTYINSDTSKSWLEESTVEMENSTLEYGGMFNINSDGSICLEPGEYQITRIPVQRYEFVENTWKMEGQPDTDYEIATTHRTTTEAMTLTVSSGQTAIVHYYDKVAYYDKFTQVNTAINKFHKP